MANQDRFHLPGINGKRVAITAGAGGIGLEIARLLHALGARLAISDIDTQALQSASQELGNCLATQADVSDEYSVDAFFDAIQSQMGGLDALINNADIAGPTEVIHDISPAE